MKELEKYKHYLVVVFALIFALYITEPMVLTYGELHQTNQLNKKRASKLNNLLDEQNKLLEKLDMANQEASTLQSYIFNKPTESEFKLTAQTLIGNTLETAGCSIERVTWRGETPISDSISQWRINIRFNGNALCTLKATKGIEQLIPLVRILEYNYTSRDWDGSFNHSLVGDIDLIMWNEIKTIVEEKVPGSTT